MSLNRRIIFVRIVVSRSQKLDHSMIVVKRDEDDTNDDDDVWVWLYVRDRV